MQKRVEFLGNKDGREYFIDLNDERIVKVNGEASERLIDSAIDAFEDGYNVLKEVEGRVYEYQKTGPIEIMRRAYLSDLGDL